MTIPHMNHFVIYLATAIFMGYIIIVILEYSRLSEILDIVILSNEISSVFSFLLVVYSNLFRVL